MSFSSTVKNELCRIDVNKECCLLSELAAVVRISGLARYYGDEALKIRVTTENAPFARKMFSLIKKLCNIYPQVAIRRNSRLKKHVLYILDISPVTGIISIGERIAVDYGVMNCEGASPYGSYADNIASRECCKKAYIRGAFLAAGSISDPEKTYHLEIAVHDRMIALELKDLINSFGLNSKIVGRKGSFVVYIKEGEDIVDFLNIIGAHRALMDLENIRILKEMRNNVNRVVNCETANLQKTVNASVRQVENIKYINRTIGFDNLPENLRQIAEVRIEYTDANLKELGEMLSPPLGKSGVNHRLRKLDEIAEDLRNLKGDT